MSEETKESKPFSLRDTIVPKSDQINYDDLANGIKRRVKVMSLKRGGDDQPVRVVIADADTGDKLRDYVPCKSMRRVLIAAWGDKGADWVGKVIELYGDPSVTWAGEAIGGLRISALSGISKPLTIALTATRGKRKTITIAVI